jgi:tryptophan synthase alpha subunit
VPFETVGYPTVDISIEVVRAVVDAGADAVELGVPFSDPLAEGPTIQKSSFHALSQGVTPATCIDAARRLRDAGVRVPLVLMGYYNPILSYGPEKFCSDAAAAGVDGLIVSDLPTEEAGPLRATGRKHGLDLVPLLALTSTEARIAAACDGAAGFVYCVSVLGVTGARAAMSARVRGLVGLVRKHTQLPVAVGFGISSAAHVSEAGEFADGVAVGSALIDAIGAGPVEGAPDRAGAFITELGRGAARKS